MSLPVTRSKSERHGRTAGEGAADSFVMCRERMRRHGYSLVGLAAQCLGSRRRTRRKGFSQGVMLVFVARYMFSGEAGLVASRLELCRWIGQSLPPSQPGVVLHEGVWIGR